MMMNRLTGLTDNLPLEITLVQIPQPLVQNERRETVLTGVRVGGDDDLYILCVSTPTALYSGFHSPKQECR